MVKKLTRIQKRQNLKRKKKTTEPGDVEGENNEDGENGDLPIEKKVDKAAIKAQVEQRDYDMTLHFSKKSVLDIE